MAQTHHAEDSKVAGSAWDETDFQLLLGRPPRVLIVEDEADILHSLMEWFGSIGWSVQGVGDGSAFFEVVEPVLAGEKCEEYFDIIITDISMPGVDVVAILEGLRKIGCDVPVAVISAVADPKLPQRILNLGRARFLAKPFFITTLNDEVHSLLAHWIKDVPRH